MSARTPDILAALAEHGRVEVAGLAARFGVSEKTVRRDLDALEARGLLRRAHGGAIAAGGADELEAAARSVLSLLPTAGVVFVDDGAVGERLATLLAERAELTVVTASVAIAMAASPTAGAAHVYLLGAPAWAIEHLAEVRIDVAVLTGDGRTSEGMLTASDPDRAALLAAAAAAADTTVLVVPAGGFATAGFTVWRRESDIDHVVAA